MRQISCVLLLWGSLSGTIFGQNVTVQQPVIGATAVNTSVAVPDRGSAFLGGVSSAQSGRSRYGFGQPSSSIGLSRSSNSMSVAVTIVDLHEMDEAILNSVPDRPQSSSPFARHAAAINRSTVESPQGPARETESAAERVAKFERLARKAEAENRPGVAKLHWQMAAKYGSTLAREQLTPTTSQPSGRARR